MEIKFNGSMRLTLLRLNNFIRIYLYQPEPGLRAFIRPFPDNFVFGPETIMKMTNLQAKTG